MKLFSLGLISLRDIERVHKKRAHDKESRLETVLVSHHESVVGGYLTRFCLGWSRRTREIWKMEKRKRSCGNNE